MHSFCFIDRCKWSNIRSWSGSALSNLPALSNVTHFTTLVRVTHIIWIVCQFKTRYATVCHSVYLYLRICIAVYNFSFLVEPMLAAWRILRRQLEVRNPLHTSLHKQCYLFSAHANRQLCICRQRMCDSGHHWKQRIFRPCISWRLRHFVRYSALEECETVNRQSHYGKYIMWPRSEIRCM